MIDALLKGLLLGFLLSISIGPVIFAILKQSLTNGRKAGFIFVAGVSASDITLLTICNIFTSLFTMVLNHKAMIALAGSGFLLLMGVYTLFFKKIKFNPDEEEKEKRMSTRDLLTIFASGFFMNTLNPSVFLFWFAWTAAIGVSAGGTNNAINYKLIVFGACLLFVLISDLAKVALASVLRPKLTLRNLVVINRISGFIILIFSAALFYGALNY